MLALHRYLALTPARLIGAALVDLVGDRRTQNQPGTVDEYPNWRVPLSGPDGEPMSLEDVLRLRPGGPPRRGPLLPLTPSHAPFRHGLAVLEIRSVSPRRSGPGG